MKTLDSAVAIHEITQHTATPERFRVYTARQLDQIPHLRQLSEQQRFDMRVVASVLPFRVHQYAIDHLIDWSAVPEDPIFQLSFPQRGMLAPEHFERVARARCEECPSAEFNALLAEVRHALSPHPTGQLEYIIPRLHGERVEGIQHKYREAVL